MFNRRQRAQALGLWLLGLMLLAACPCAKAGWVEDRDGQTVIHVRVFGLPDPANADTFNRAEVAGVRAFKQRFSAIFAQQYRDRYKANPAKYGQRNWDDVQVELEPFTGIRVEGVEVDLLAIAGGMAPDVLYINFRKSDNYIQNRFLYPLDKPEDGYLTGMSQAEVDFRIHPKLWPVLRRKGPDGDMHVWAIPWGGAIGKVLLFRKDLFDEKSVPYPTTRWTWNDMLGAARKMTDPKRGTYGLLLARGKQEAYLWLTFLWSAGGEVMAYNEARDDWRCVFDSRQAAMALDYYIRLSAEKWVDGDGLLRRGYSTKDTADCMAKWDRGEVGMMLANIDEKVFATINPEMTGMAPVPLGPTGLRGGELNSRMMGLFSGIKEPAVRDAAWEYMRFYEGEEADAIKTRVMVEGGYGRFVNPKYLQRFGYPEIEQLSPPGWAEMFNIALETGRPEPYGRNSNFAYEMMTDPIQEAEQLALKDKLPADSQARLELLHGLLRRACARANEKMIGLIPPAERKKRQMVAAAVLTVIIVTFALLLRRVFGIFSPRRAGLPPASSRAWRRHPWTFALLFPALLSVLVWQYVPLLRGSLMAFQDYRLIGHPAWVGLDNFGDVLFDNDWWRAVWNSVRYSFLVIALTFLPPVILAILLQEVPRGKLFFRTLYYLPAVITGLVTVLLWKQFYDPSERGVLNAVVLRIPAIGFVAAGLVLLALALLFAMRLWRHGMLLAAWGFVVAGAMLLAACMSLAGDILFPAREPLATSLAHFPARLLQRPAEAFRWLSNPDTAMLSCVIPMVWAGVGPGCLIYLAALKGIANEYYEAADVDGASFVEKILFVTFPILKPLLIINFVGVFIGAWFGATANILAMTGGGANTEEAGLHIWFAAFTYLKFGPATAMAWMLGSMLIGFTVYQLRILSRVEFRAAGGGKS